MLPEIDLATITPTDAESAMLDIDAQIEELQSLRASLAAIVNGEARLAALQVDVLTARGLRPGGPWRRPHEPQDAYPEGWSVRHGGSAWTSAAPANRDEPGKSPAWVEAAKSTATEPAPEVEAPVE